MHSIRELNIAHFHLKSIHNNIFEISEYYPNIAHFHLKSIHNYLFSLVFFTGNIAHFHWMLIKNDRAKGSNDNKKGHGE